jgi:hypothetical protein
MKKRLLFLLAAAAADAGCAQAPAVPQADQPALKAPPLEYRSAFEGYQGFSDDKLLPWRDANDAVKDGGHR